MNQENVYLLKSDKSKYVISFVSSSVFTVLSYRLMQMSESNLMIILILLFVLCAIASIIPILPNQSYLKIDGKTGLTIRNMFRTIHIGWNEVERFYAFKKNNKKMVGFSYINKKRNYMNIENLLFDIEVLPDNYGMKADELADLLEYYRVRNI